MQAAGHADQGPAAGAASLHGEQPHPTPVYAISPGGRRSPATSLDGSLRGWPVQLAQWALVFGALGLLIVGVKWWDRHRARAISSPAQASAATSVMTAGSNEQTGR